MSCSHPARCPGRRRRCLGRRPPSENRRHPSRQPPRRRPRVAAGRRAAVHSAAGVTLPPIEAGQTPRRHAQVVQAAAEGCFDGDPDAALAAEVPGAADDGERQHRELSQPLRPATELDVFLFERGIWSAGVRAVKPHSVHVFCAHDVGGPIAPHAHNRETCARSFPPAQRPARRRQADQKTDAPRSGRGSESRRSSRLRGRCLEIRPQEPRGHSYPFAPSRDDSRAFAAACSWA
jgi:hypothetical protein